MDEVVKAKRQAAQAEQLHREMQLKESMVWALSDPRGRRLLWAVMEQCGLWQVLSGPAGADLLNYREGQRTIGSWILSKIAETDPAAFIVMQQEHADAA